MALACLRFRLRLGRLWNLAWAGNPRKPNQTQQVIRMQWETIRKSWEQMLKYIQLQSVTYSTVRTIEMQENTIEYYRIL